MENNSVKMKTYCFGVDLGGTSVKLGLFSGVGDLLEKWEIATRKEASGAHILEDISASILGKMAEKGIKTPEVGGIGIGVPGPVLRGSFVTGCVNLGWKNVDVAGELSAMTGLSVVVANDANIAALGEQWQGGGRAFNNLVMVTLGTGVGGGVIINGRIHDGIGGAAGEIGHMLVVNPEDVIGVCNCGHVGCLEQAASATGLTHMTEKMLLSTDKASCLRDCEKLDAKCILDAAKAGDALAVAATEKMFDALGRALSYIACVLDTEAFVIGGGVSKAGTYLLEGIRRHYREAAFHGVKDAEFVLATLGNDAGIFGAAKMICDACRAIKEETE